MEKEMHATAVGIQTLLLLPPSSPSAHPAVNLPGAVELPGVAPVCIASLLICSGSPEANRMVFVLEMVKTSKVCEANSMFAL